MRIGVLGGSFNPVHMGHLVIAQEAASLLCLERVFFVVAGSPPHKEGKQLADAEARYEMVTLACKTNRIFQPSRAEMGHQEVSYTIDTMRGFIKEHGPDVYFIAGQDAMEDIYSWKSAATLLKTVNFAVAARGGYDKEALAEFIAGSLSARYHNLKFKPGPPMNGGLVTTLGVVGATTVINILNTPSLELSSSDIRRRLAEGRPVKYLVPDAVERYLRKTKPYGGGKIINGAGWKKEKNADGI